MVYDTSNKVKVVQEKAKVKIMEITTNIEKLGRRDNLNHQRKCWRM
ncbi:hypothetical protein IC582_007309 [Cucumis melo]